MRNPNHSLFSVVTEPFARPQAACMTWAYIYRDIADHFETSGATLGRTEAPGTRDPPWALVGWYMHGTKCYLAIGLHQKE